MAQQRLMYYLQYALIYILSFPVLYSDKSSVLSFFLLSPGVTEYVLRIWHGVGGSVDWKIDITVYIKQLIRCILRKET
jgi:hypothetical protein